MFEVTSGQTTLALASTKEFFVALPSSTSSLKFSKLEIAKRSGLSSFVSTRARAKTWPSKTIIWIESCSESKN